MSYLFNSIQKSVVTLATADILALNATAFDLTPAPPSGSMIHPIKIILNYKAGTIPFGVGAGSPYFRLRVNTVGDLSTGTDGSYSSALITTLPVDQWGDMTGLFYSASFPAGEQPIGSFGAAKSVTLSLTQVTNVGGGDAQYTGTITNGNTTDGVYSGYWFNVTGFTNAANNGIFQCDPNANPASNATTLTLLNGSAVNESHAATAVSVNFMDGQPLQLFSQLALTAGGVLTATVTPGNGGTGYNNGDTGEITGGTNGSGAIYTVLTSTGGVVNTVSITQPGNSYIAGETGDATTVLTGSGDGTLQLDIGTPVQTGNGSLEVTTYYEVVPLP